MKFNLESIGIREGEVKWHLLVLSVYFVYVSAAVILHPDFHLTDIVLSWLISAVVFYSCIPFIYSFLNGAYFRGGAILIMSVILFILMRWGAYYFYTGISAHRDMPSLISGKFWAEGYYIYLQFFLYAVIYSLLKRNADSEKEKRILSEEKVRAEIVNNDLERKILLEERLRYVVESNFLHSRVDTHFLKNTLSFLYAQSLTVDNEVLQDSILLFSDVLSYSLISRSDSQARVPLRAELHHLENYIAVYQLRYNGRLQISLELPEDTGNLTIIPLIMQSLLENAFEVCDVQNEEEPLVIRVETDKGKGTLLFEIYHTATTIIPQRLSRNRIENVRHRLDACYKGRYRLDTDNKDGYFVVAMFIQLHVKPDAGDLSL